MASSQRIPLCPVNTLNSSVQNIGRQSMNPTRKSLAPVGAAMNGKNVVQNGEYARYYNSRQTEEYNKSSVASRHSIMPVLQNQRPSLSCIKSGMQRSSIAVQGASRQSMSFKNSHNGVSNTQSTIDAVGRRMSIYTDVKIKVDPRPIKDRSYMQKCVYNLVEYLRENDYDKPLNAQTLNSPSTKNFFYFVEFLFKKIDYSFQLHKKPEEEIPNLFKVLRYPFQMSARSISSVGSPHTWPTYLAALNWMVELLKYDEAAYLQRLEVLKKDEDSQESLREAFFDYIAQAYDAFMCNNDELDQELESRFVQTLVTRNEERKLAIEEKNKHILQLEQEIECLQNHEGRVHVLSNRIFEVEEDLVKLNQLTAELERYKSELTKALFEKSEVVNQERQEVERLQAEIAQLDERLQQQLAKNLDVDKINQECRHLEKCTQIAVAHRKEIEEDIWRIEMEISKQFNEIEKKVSFYNQYIRTTKLCTKFGGEMRFDPRAEPMISLDLKKEVKPALSEYLEELRRCHKWNQEVIFELSNKVEQVTERVEKKRSQCDDLKHQLEKETELLTKLREDLDEQRRSTRLQISQLRSEVEELVSKYQESVSSREEKRTLILEKLKENEQKYALEKKQVQDVINQVALWLITHKEHISGKLAQLLADSSLSS